MKNPWLIIESHTTEILLLSVLKELQIYYTCIFFINRCHIKFSNMPKWEEGLCVCPMIKHRSWITVCPRISCDICRLEYTFSDSTLSPAGCAIFTWQFPFLSTSHAKHYFPFLSQLYLWSHNKCLPANHLLVPLRFWCVCFTTKRTVMYVFLLKSNMNNQEWTFNYLSKCSHVTKRG